MKILDLCCERSTSREDLCSIARYDDPLTTTVDQCREDHQAVKILVDIGHLVGGEFYLFGTVVFASAVIILNPFVTS